MQVEIKKRRKKYEGKTIPVFLDVGKGMSLFRDECPDAER